MKFSGQILQVEGDQVRRQFPSCRFDDFRKLAQFCGKRLFMGRVKAREVGISKRASPLFIVVPLGEQGADASMSVLDVIDRVFIGLACGEIKVEVEVLIDVYKRQVVDAYKNMGDAIKVPIIVRLQGTNAEIAKELIDNSGMPILSAVQFQEAADQVQKALS